MATDRTTWHGFLLYADGTIDMLTGEDDGTGAEIIDTFTEPGLYNDLVLAGYPLHSDQTARFDGTIDLAVDPANPTDVIAYSGRDERAMGAASELFLAWYRSNVAG